MTRTINVLLRRYIPGRWVEKLRDLSVPWRYCGDEYECPFCHGVFGSMLPFGFDLPVLKEMDVVGGGYRTNAQCPRCGSKDRDRLVYLYLLRKTGIAAAACRVLHVAPESALRKALAAMPHVDYVCADLHPESGMMEMDITRIQFPDRVFDIVICNHVLEHVPDYRTAMAELRRIMKPGGCAVLQVPIARALAATIEDPAVTDAKERERRFGQYDHIRLYGRDYLRRLEEAGFSVTVCECVRDFGAAAVHRYGLQKDEDLYLCAR